MVQLTTEHRVFVVKHLFATNSYVEVRRLFQITFPGRPPPTDMAIYRNVKSKVFISLPENMDDLKIKVRSALDAVK